MPSRQDPEHLKTPDFYLRTSLRLHQNGENKVAKGLDKRYSLCYSHITMQAKQIKAIRKRLKMTQQQLARELGVDFTTVNRWENSKARPSQMAIRQLERLERKAITNAVKAEIKKK